MSDSYLLETRDPERRVGEPRSILRGILARHPIVEDPRRLHLLDVAFGPTADAGYQTNERSPQVVNEYSTRGGTLA